MQERLTGQVAALRDIIANDTGNCYRNICIALNRLRDAQIAAEDEYDRKTIDEIIPPLDISSNDLYPVNHLEALRLADQLLDMFECTDDEDNEDNEGACS